MSPLRRQAVAGNCRNLSHAFHKAVTGQARTYPSSPPIWPLALKLPLACSVPGKHFEGISVTCVCSRLPVGLRSKNAPYRCPRAQFHLIDFTCVTFATFCTKRGELVAAPGSGRHRLIYVARTAMDAHDRWRRDRIFTSRRLATRDRLWHRGTSRSRRRSSPNQLV
jgi:hypothetical protein